MNHIQPKPNFPFDSFPVSLELRILRTLSKVVSLRGPEAYQAVNFDKQVDAAEFHRCIEGLTYAQHLESDGLVAPSEYGILPKGLRRLEQLEARHRERYMQHLDAMILRTIKDSPKPLYGLQVQRGIKTLTQGEFEPTLGELSPPLHRLIFANAVATDLAKQEAPPRPPVSHFLLTPKGEALLVKKETSMNKPGQRLSRKERRQRLKIGALIILPGILGSLALGVMSFVPVQSSAKLLSTRTDGVKTYQVERGHTTQPVEYNVQPPVGGVHSPRVAPCVIVETLISSEEAVHSLEHGAVWITSRDGWKAGDKTAIVSAQKTYPAILGSLVPFQTSRYVLSAWGKQLPLDKLDPRKLELFLREFSNKGPEIVNCPTGK